MDETLDKSLRELRKLYDNRKYIGVILSVVDGDTLDALILLEPETETWIRRSVRLALINAPEIRGAESRMGRLARDHLKSLVFGNGRKRDYQVGASLTLHRRPFADRIVAEVTDANGDSYSQMMCRDGYAVAYDPWKARKKFSQDEPYPMRDDGVWRP